jgi:hypothetical protein
MRARPSFVAADVWPRVDVFELIKQMLRRNGAADRGAGRNLRSLAAAPPRDYHSFTLRTILPRGRGLVLLSSRA